MAIKFSKAAFEKFIAPGRDQVFGASPPALSGPVDGVLNRFILVSATYGLEGERWRVLFNFVRCAEAARAAYREAREALLELDQERGFDGGYFDALTQFEIALEYASRAIKAAARLAQITPYEVGTTSEAIVKLRDSFSHLDRVVAGGPPHLAVWLTASGLESSDAQLTYADFRGTLDELGVLAATLGDRRPTVPT